MSAVLYRSMLSKVKALLKVEAGHNATERSAQQWQLLFDVDGVQFIIGKGGVNTMFYTVGTADRVLCYPDELIEFLERLIRSKYASYAICNASGKIVISGLLSEEAALKKKAPVGAYIIAFENGKKVRLFVREKGIFKDVWNPFVKPKLQKSN